MPNRIGKCSTFRTKYKRQIFEYSHTLLTQNKFLYSIRKKFPTLISGQSHATESCKNTLDPKWNVYYDLLLSSEDAITISVWNDKKIHSKKDGSLIKLNNAGAFLGCVKLLSSAIQRLKDTGKQVIWTYRDLINGLILCSGHGD